MPTLLNDVSARCALKVWQKIRGQDRLLEGLQPAAAHVLAWACSAVALRPLRTLADVAVVFWRKRRDFFTLQAAEVTFNRGTLARYEIFALQLDKCAGGE